MVGLEEQPAARAHAWDGKAMNRPADYIVGSFIVAVVILALLGYI